MALLHAHVYICKCMWRPGDVASIFLRLLLYVILWARLLLNMELIN